MAKMKKVKQDNDDGGFPDKYAKWLKGNGVIEELDQADEEALKKTILLAEESIEQCDKEKEADEKLNGAKSLVKDLSKAYTETAKFQQAKIKYSLFRLEQMGKSASN